MIRKLVVIGAMTGLLALILFQSASGFIGRNTFVPTAQLEKNGRHIWVTALIACTAGERLSVEVTLTQEQGEGDERVGAIAKGQAHTKCQDVGLTPDLSDDEVAELPTQEVRIRATTRGWQNFTTDEIAVATGLAITRDRGQVTGVRQWQAANGIELEHSN